MAEYTQVFKVVRRHGDKLYSARVIVREGGVRYGRRWVASNYGPLFAFSNIQAARRFALWDDQVWRADAKEVRPAPDRVLDTDKWGIGGFIRFWLFGKTIVPTIVPPKGTVLCSQIRLNRKVAGSGWKDE